MHSDTRDGNFLSSKWITTRLPSPGALRFLGVAFFLNGSEPPALAHGWQSQPGGGLAANVYLV